jgi:hypothetical protein
LFETTTGTQARSVPTSQWQYKAGLTTEKPELDEEEQTDQGTWDEQSFEDYYSSQETEEQDTDSEGEMEKNLYGQKQAGRVWYLHLKKNLLKLGFKPSQHDECVFYYGKTIFIVYTDDTILLGPDKEEIDQLVEKLGKTLKIEDTWE